MEIVRLLMRPAEPTNFGHGWARPTLRFRSSRGGLEWDTISALYWQQRVQLARENLGIAKAVERIATKRHELGGASGLDKSIASLAVLRARSAVDRAEVTLDDAKGRLRALLGLPAATQLDLHGELRALGTQVEAVKITRERPELSALAAEMRRADMQAELGRFERIPNFAVGISYTREEFDHVVLGGLSFTLPVFNRGQESIAIAQAKHNLLRREHAALQNMADVKMSPRSSASCVSPCMTICNCPRGTM